MITTAPGRLSMTVARTDLNAMQRDAMFTLLKDHFEGVTREQFDADLAEKTHAILIQDGERLVGFSTLLVYETTFDDEPVTVVYSGDTIVAPEAWNSPMLPRAWIAAVNGLRARFPRGPYLWLLLTSGFRTYRFLPVFWRVFWPQAGAAMPENIRRLRDALARERFGAGYDAHRGIVRFPRPQRLRPSLASVPAGREQDRHIAFFLAHNPGHAAGDELVCLTELTAENLTAAGRRMVGR